jgi:hypothetical protein
MTAAVALAPGQVLVEQFLGASHLSPFATDRQCQDLIERFMHSGTHGPAARVQQHPQRWKRLLGDKFPSKVAESGLHVQLTQKPRQEVRPTMMSVPTERHAWTTQEVLRLHTNGMLELAPMHDGDKAIETDAPPWERQSVGHCAPKFRAVPPSNMTVSLDGLSQEELLLQQRLLQQNQELARSASVLPTKPNNNVSFSDWESAVFTVPKKDAGNRLCTNLKPLNAFQEARPFKLEGVKEIKAMIRPGDYGMTADLKDAYTQCGLSSVDRKLTRFWWNGVRYQWRTLMFGLAQAPYLWTKLLKPVIAHLRTIGIRCILYLDDLIVVAGSKVQTAEHMAIAMATFGEHLGLKWKVSKCDLLPKQEFEALGLIWNSDQMTVSVNKARMSALQHAAKRLLKRFKEKQPVKVRDLARVVGQAQSCTDGVQHTRRFTAALKWILRKQVKKKGWDGLCDNVDWSLAIASLEWWINQSNDHNLSPLVSRPHRRRARYGADAAGTLGWGAWLEFAGKTWTTFGVFTPKETKEHINVKEFLAQVLGARPLVDQAIPRHLQVDLLLEKLTDNTTALRYANKLYGPVQRLVELSCEQYDWAVARGLEERSSHIAGVDHILADDLSRIDVLAMQNDLSEWSIPTNLMRTHVFQVWGQPDFDLFATRVNKHCKRFASYRLDDEAELLDAFRHNWRGLGMRLYAFPPFNQVARTIKKVNDDKVHQMILVTPFWPTQSWFPALMRMSTELPYVLPSDPMTLRPPLSNSDLTWSCKWPLIVWNISSLTASGVNLRETAYSSVCSGTRTDAISSMIPRGTSLYNGAGDQASEAETASTILTSFQRILR